MALKTLFPRARELTNYDYFDIAEGVGYTVYYGFVGDSNEKLVSTSSTIYSESICTYLVTETMATSFTKEFDMDFDITFNRPKNIKGRVFANIPIGISATTSSDLGFEYYTIVKVIHYNGGETILATGTSRTVIAENLNTTGISFYALIAACKMDITTIAHFKKGETLRFTVEGWYKTTEGTAKSAHVMICHDPKNRPFQGGKRAVRLSNDIQFANEEISGGTVTYQNTQMIFHVPFVLDI